jgi:2,5-diketo-D-gluconate reductase A
MKFGKGVQMKQISLNNGYKLPQQGFGVFQIDDPNIAEESVYQAIKSGYRLIDTAATYRNERSVGNAVKRSMINRKDIYLSSKVWIQDASYENTLKSFYKTLDNLGVDYLDLYLIHMPLGDYHGAWRAMEELYKAGKIRAIGVCNFTVDRLADLILSHSIIPSINQIELHPFNQQKELREFMSKYRIMPMAWAPFAEGQNNLFTDETLVKIGERHGRTAAQVTLKWLNQENVIAIPKTVHKERMEENLDIENFILSKIDLSKISQIDKKRPLILDINDVREVYRLHEINFIQ